MRIIKEQREQRSSTDSNGVSNKTSSTSTSKVNNWSTKNHHGTTTTTTNLCDDCEVFQQCQFARDLSFSQTSHLSSHKFLGPGATNHLDQDHRVGRLTTTVAPVVDRHHLAERLKLRYKTCPFHREISLG